ncbi:DUF6236 family protein [Paenibacillus xylanexedens]|uniref:DUF6236 family protein n=1 Tax=Paenibacillus xylanexedens TaxID=528191 RepID=UPI0011A04B1B|nr:DUF6236 family protein [Paenibacillus xylanexedens]
MNTGTLDEIINLSEEKKMRRTIMYYPSIEIPDGNWFRNALLYWDEVSSIVPRSMERDLYSNNRIISELNDEGYYRPIHPDYLMSSEHLPDFEKECVRRIKSYKKMLENPKGRINTRINSIQSNNSSLKSNYFIHDDKLSYKIKNLLEREDLMTRREQWNELDNRLAIIYMSTLAKYIALSDVHQTVIGTDQIKDINDVYPVKYASKKAGKYKTPVFNILFNYLPTPSSDVSYNKIIKFKIKYKEDLLSFRNTINDFEKKISNCPTETELKEEIVKFKEVIEKGTRETTRMLKGAGVSCFLSSVRSVINLKSPTMLATLTGIAGNELLNFSPSMSLAGVGIAGAVDVSVNYMSINKTTKDKLADKGFLYLYHARRKGIINDFI